MVALLEAWARLLFNALVQRFERKQKNRQKIHSAAKLDDEKSGVLIGHTIPSARSRGSPEPVWVSFKTRLRMFAISGKVGAGKTSLMRILFLDDLARGNGLVNIDAYGESTDLFLAYLAERYSQEELKERLVIIDLRKASAYGEPDEPVVVFNLLEIGSDPYATTAFILDLLRQVWGEGGMGVQLTYDLRHVLLALTLSPAGPFTILDVAKVLTDPAFRAMVVSGITDPVVTSLFKNFDEVKDPSSRVLPVINKLSPLTDSNLRLRQMVGGTNNSYSFRKHIEQRSDLIALVCLAINETKKEVAGIVGATLLSAAIKSVIRTDHVVAEEPERGVHFMLDELPAYSSGIEEPLSELWRIGRKHGAFASACFQEPGDFSNSVRNMLIDVSGSFCCFSQGKNQAEIIAGWVSSDTVPKAVVRTFLAEAEPGEALLMQSSRAPQRIKTTMVPYPNVADEKVRELRRASLAHWGSMPLSQLTTPAASPSPEPMDAAKFAAPIETIETREVLDAPKRARRKKKL